MNIIIENEKKYIRIAKEAADVGKKKKKEKKNKEK